MAGQCARQSYRQLLLFFISVAVLVQSFGEVMLFRTIVSAFFLEPSSNENLATLVNRAGMTELAVFDAETRTSLGIHEPDRPVLGGIWGAFQETWATVDILDHVECLHLYSAATRYLDARRAARGRHGADDGPLAAYVRTFHDACLSLNPKLAFFDTKPHFEHDGWDNKQGSRAFVLDQAPLVSAGDANAMVGMFFNLLYLNKEMLACWTDATGCSDRDVMAMPTGRLIFARSSTAGKADTG